MGLRKELSMNEIIFMYGKISTSNLAKLFPHLGNGLD